MGIGTFLKSLVDPAFSGEEIIAMQEEAYRKAQEVNPNAEPHMLLALVWMRRMAEQGKNCMDEMIHKLAFSETKPFACISPPDNVRALGLYFIVRERPDIIRKHPKFEMEFTSLMSPVNKAIENGSFAGLYKRYNPNMAGKL